MKDEGKRPRCQAWDVARGKQKSDKMKFADESWNEYSNLIMVCVQLESDRDRFPEIMKDEGKRPRCWRREPRLVKRDRLPEIMKDEGKRHRGEQKSDKMKVADESVNPICLPEIWRDETPEANRNLIR